MAHGPSGSEACLAIVVSLDGCDIIQIAYQLDDASVAMLEDHAARSLPTAYCVDDAGNPIPEDALLDTCRALVDLRYDRDRRCLTTASGLGFVVGVGLNIIGCWTVVALGGGIATPACIALAAGTSMYVGCMLAQWEFLSFDRDYAMGCCCTLAECRATGEPNCPDIEMCIEESRFCDEVPCMPGL
ncbi:MAG: hypothetical protein KJZ65_02190 [Phycisphaerales bacterium]|nr:hypothetical protein [Phycisphaerales bacterium]